MKPTNTFRELAAAYADTLPFRLEHSMLEQNTMATIPYCDVVMIRKVRKHLENQRPDKAANYVARRLGEFSEPLSDWARGVLRTTSLRGEPARRARIVFTNSDGAECAVEFDRAK